MKKTCSALLFTCLFCFLSIPSIAAENEGSVGYKLDVKLILDDGRIFEPSATLVSGEEARLTFSDTLEDTSSIQLRLRALPRDNATFFIRAQVLELNDRKWTILNEVDAAGYLDEKMSFDIGGFAYIEVEGTEVAIADTGAVSNFDCNQGSRPFTMSSGHTGKTEKNCCSSACQDGSGLTLKCCNVVSCSGCGTSCSP